MHETDSPDALHTLRVTVRNNKVQQKRLASRPADVDLEEYSQVIWLLSGLLLLVAAIVAGALTL